MKALILAAGFGTRLRPYTEQLPKPLFPVGGEPILDRTIRQLVQGGCEEVIINTHHLSGMIKEHVSRSRYPVPVTVRFEETILDTAGAMRNVADILGNDPFIVVNGDIVTDVDYAEVYRFHQSHDYPVTLVLHDYPEFNCVTTDPDGFVQGFYLCEKHPGMLQDLAFTGIQVLDERVLGRIPPKGPYGSLDLYRSLIRDKDPVKAMILPRLYWIDMGTPEKYLSACRNISVPEVFETVYGRVPENTLSPRHLCGDGSDRTYSRFITGNRSLILCDHGITMNKEGSEVAAFAAIGKHLHSKNIPVPSIFHADLFSGQIIMEDLGDVHLAQWLKTATPESRLDTYKNVLDILVRMSVTGHEGFQAAWTCQTACYDRDLIIQREGRYFVSAFINGVLQQNLPENALDEEFQTLADRALTGVVPGFMHRDFQSRNIMVQEGRCRVIDFQGGRTGPVQYDLASLLIDPYAAIDPDVQEKLFACFHDRYSHRIPVSYTDFHEPYKYLCITRNLQMLGAFGFLSRVKGKHAFETFIPNAVNTLKKNIKQIEGPPFKGLKKIIEKL